MTRPLLLSAFLCAALACRADDCAKQTSHLIDLSTYVLKAKIMTVGSPPGFYTAVTPAIQDVQYEIERNYKGKLPEENITVEHRIYKGSRLAQKKPIGLNETIFKPGNEVFVFLQTPRLDIKNECAVQIATPALENQLRDLLHTQ